MITRCTTYPDEIAARHATDELVEAGVPGSAIRLLLGAALHDTRATTVGGLAGPVGPDAHVGTFAGSVVLRRQAAGSFAEDPDSHRQGSFADNDRVTVVSYRHGTERLRVTGSLGLRRAFRAAAPDEAVVARANEALTDGDAMLLVAAPAVTSRTTQAPAEQATRAA